MDNYRDLIEEIEKNKCLIESGLLDVIDIKNYIKVDKIFNLIYHLLKSNNLLEDNQQRSDDSGKFNKIVFTHEYPTEVMNDNCVVTFELTKRCCATFSAKTMFVKEANTVYRPIRLFEKEDLQNGGNIIYNMSPFDNEITLYCWANKVEHAQQIASLIENIIISAYYYIKQSVGIFIYEGRHTPILSKHYGEKGIIGIPLKFLARTYEFNCVKTKILDKLPQLISEDIK